MLARTYTAALACLIGVACSPSQQAHDDPGGEALALLAKVERVLAASPVEISCNLEAVFKGDGFQGGSGDAFEAVATILIANNSLAHVAVQLGGRKKSIFRSLGDEEVSDSVEAHVNWARGQTHIWRPGLKPTEVRDGTTPKENLVRLILRGGLQRHLIHQYPHNNNALDQFLKQIARLQETHSALTIANVTMRRKSEGAVSVAFRVEDSSVYSKPAPTLALTGWEVELTVDHSTYLPLMNTVSIDLGGLLLRSTETYRIQPVDALPAAAFDIPK